MENTLFTTKNYGNCKANERENIIATNSPARTNMIQINKLNNTQHLLYKNRWRTSRQSPYKNKLNKFIAVKTPTTKSKTQTNTSIISIINRMKQQMFYGLTQQHIWWMLWLLLTLIHHVKSLDTATTRHKTKGTEISPTLLFSQLLSTHEHTSMYDETSMNNDDTFRPFVPKDPEEASRNMFTPSGHYRVFQPIDTDLRVAVPMQRKSQHYKRNKMSTPLNTSLSEAFESQQQSMEIIKTHKVMVHQTESNNLLHTKQLVHKTEHGNKTRREQERKLGHQQKHEHTHKHSIAVDDYAEGNAISQHDDLTSDLKSLEDLLVDYVTNFFEKGQYQPMPGLLLELHNNHSQPLPNKLDGKTRTVRQTAATDAQVRIDLPRTLQTGRLLFLTGLKKVLWPVFMGLQVLKSLLIAMFIPAIIGSFTKLLGKGISTGSAPLFIRPIEPPQELDFRDNSLVFEEDQGIKMNGPYVYTQPDALQINNEYVFDPSSAINQVPFTHLGKNERQHQLMQDSYMNALQSIGSASFKNSGSLSSSSSGLVAPMAKRPPPAANVNTFQQFQNVPDSSLLLSNYDPFYSPLLSRLDSVFAQLKLNSDKEICREKLICLMYANPAKYAPYSNLVSAQLSRELNELRKPTSDNPDILRFFKYMRAAKDGQDGVDCEETFDKCTEFKDFENPAMVSTYHDINKLVQARKLTSK